MNIQTYLLLIAEKSGHTMAAAALGVLVSNDAIHTLGDVPWYAMLSVALIAGIASILGSLSSQAVPNTLPTSFVRKPTA